MSFWRGRRKNRPRLYRTGACATCPLRSRCTRNKLGRIIFRSEHQDVIDRLRARLSKVEGLDKLSRRKEIVEHPFGTMKRAFNQGYLLLKGLRKVNGGGWIQDTGLQFEASNQHPWEEETDELDWSHDVT